VTSTDIGGAFAWAMDHMGVVIWAIAIIGGTIFGNRAKRRRQQQATRVVMPGPAPVTVAPPAPPPVAAAAPANNFPPSSRPQPRAVTPVAPGTPVAAGALTARSGLLGAFADPAHARTAVVLAELLAPPVALR
jgi:hypothetical protein